MGPRIVIDVSSAESAMADSQACVPHTAPLAHLSRQWPADAEVTQGICAEGGTFGPRDVDPLVLGPAPTGSTYRQTSVNLLYLTDFKDKVVNSFYVAAPTHH
ncbi:hypothetical protein DL770_000341 [Monosporascus sp. CRB-9-2]|nr:hypothetical protein DL770_000341 [Monosporascus sp. CRB-9-2]